MRNWIALMGLFCLPMLLLAQYPGFTPVADLAAFKTRFAEAAEKTNTIKSDFVQEKNMSMLSEKITSKGKFWFKKENRVRMEYTSPFQYLLIINQSKVYIKDGQKENTISTRSSRVFQQISQITVDCVQGTALSNPDFKIRVFENKQDFLIEMTPLAKGLKDFFKTINITASKADYGVSRIDMTEQGGDLTTMHFLNKITNDNISDAVFAVK